MNNLQLFIEQGESELLEFKRSFGKESIESLSAFANTSGGTVLIGISDKGKVLGTHTTQESIQQWINQIKSSTSPSIIPDVEYFTHESKTVISLSVISYPIKPISFKGKYYKRIHNSNHLMDLSEIANEHLKTINLSWDFASDPNHDISDISLEKVNRFIEIANRFRDYPVTDDPLTVLKKFELLRKNFISFGCFLLFCKNPSLISTIDAGRFDSEIIIRDNITIRDDLFAEVEICMNFVQKHISKRFIISGKPERDEVWEYPLEAVREIIINMIVHRDYRSQNDSTIKIFENKIEFFNPGSLPAGVEIQDILSGRMASNPRNKQIASIFKEAGIIEKYGSGIKRVRQAMKDAGSPNPLFETIADNFKVTLFPVGEIKNGGVNKLLDFIKANPGIKTKEIKTALDLPQRTVERLLKQLRDNMEIKFQGAPKTGGYYAIDKSRGKIHDS